jgi:alpha-1,6-mannosyltransferase
MRNYPGGVALRALNKAGRKEGRPEGTSTDLISKRNSSHAFVGLQVHLCNLAVQSGASLFLHEYSSPVLLSASEWIYDKTEGIVATSNATFTHAIVEDLAHVGNWTTLEEIKGFECLTLHGMQEAAKLWIIARPHSTL